jgi:hypothetical protein
VIVIDYSQFKFAKSRPKALDKADADRARDAKDKAENAKARTRAKGQCEVLILLVGGAPTRKPVYARCPNKDTQTHHLIGGIGRRNKGKSILADYKLRVCEKCHAAITANILRPTTAQHDAYTVRYWRAS